MLSTFFSRIIGGSLAALCAFLPMACNTGSDEGAGGSGLFMAFVSIDRETQTVRTISEDWNCDTDPPTLTKDTVTTHYRIEDGKLKIWDEGECEMLVYTGTSTDLVGRWETTLMNNMETNPDAGEECADITGEDDFMSALAYENFKMTLDITEQGAKATYQGSYCGARLNAAMLMDVKDAQGTSEAFTVSKFDCALVEGKRKADEKPIKVSSSQSGNLVTLKVEFNGKTCSYSAQDLLSAAGGEACSGFFDFEAYFNYMQCLEDAGLDANGGVLEKGAVGVKALRGWAR